MNINSAPPNKRIVTLIRDYSNDHGMFGRLFYNKFSCFTLELPWRDNKPNKSCIPTGTYKVKWMFSGRYGKKYELQNVENRTNILIHRGNYAGDTKKGLKSDVGGCILLGKRRGIINNQQVILLSTPTVRKFEQIMQHKPFVINLGVSV